MLYSAPGLTVYFCILAVILGACMGSFLNCFAWRIVHGESVVKGRSHCDKCNHALSARDLIPVVSYLASHGKCRYCGAKLSVRHLVAELSTAAVYLAVLLTYDISLQALEYALFGSLLLACAFADLEGYIIPDRFVVSLIAVRLVFLVLTGAGKGEWVDSLLGGFAVGGGLLLIVLAFEKIRKVEAMGGGDLKLLFATGLYLGWKGNLLCLFAACILGIVFGLAATKGKKETAFPWGPSISAAAILAALWGNALIEAYLGLF